MKYCSMKEINELVRQQLKKNWSFSRKGKHGRLMPPGRDGGVRISVCEAV